MAGIWNKLAQGQQLYMQKQRNAMAQDKYDIAKQRDQQTRDILSEAVTPSSPQMPQAEAMGPLPMGGAPLQDYPAQAFRPARMDMQNALGAMYEGGLGPEAMEFEAKRSQARLADRTPSAVREHKYFMTEVVPQGPKAVDQYLNLRRAPKILDYGGGFGAVSPSDPSIVTGIQEKTLKPEQEIPYIEEKAITTVTGRETGGEQAELSTMEANLPNLHNIVGKLGKLGQIATYTSAGKARDILLRESGMGMSEGGIARKEYMSMVSNEILPLLRITFGAAFTVPEGKELKSTLGDPDATPAEKNAVLKSFINSKIEQIKSKRRRVGTAEYKVGDITKGPDDKNYVIKSLKQDGTPDEVMLAQ